MKQSVNVPLERIEAEAARALPPGTAGQPLRSFEVLKPFEVQSGAVAPWLNQPGRWIAAFDTGEIATPFDPRSHKRNHSRINYVTYIF